MITFCAAEVPKWNPINVCSYHLQEAGATPVQEVAFTLANAVAVLDAVKATGRVPDDEFAARRRPDLVLLQRGDPLHRGDVQDARVHRAVGPASRASATASTIPKFRRFRYGVQVNSLGLAATQPENNVYRILFEALAVTLSKDARARAAAAAGVERGARASAAVGPAVVAPPAADPRVRDRPARVRGRLRGSEVDRGEDRARSPTARGKSCRRCSTWAARSRRSST